MSEFKEGDRVCIVYPEGGPAWHGRPGTVTEVRPGMLFAYIVKLDHPTPIAQGGFSASQLRTEPEDA